eukprot:gene5821-11124_t
MKKAAKEEHDAIGIPEDQVAECKTMFDGTWRKRGYASLQGAVAVISAVTGKCLDYEALNKKLMKDDIMSGCLGGYTQNNCEAINHLIWSRCPQISHSGRDHLDAAVAAAVVAFNDGLARVLSHVGINPESHMLLGLSARDRKRKKRYSTLSRLKQ